MWNSLQTARAEKHQTFKTRLISKKWRPLLEYLEDRCNPVAPSIISNANVMLAENIALVIDVQSNDPEGETEGSGLTYTISGGDDQNLFDIDEDTGELTFQAAPDFEMPLDNGGDNVYEVQVTVTDSEQLTDTQDLTITVTDEDEAPTITTNAVVDVPENQTAVIDIDSTDPEGDTEGNGLTYTISGGDDEALFEIDTNTGELTFILAPDFENPLDDNTDNVYEVQVTVTDSGQMTASQDLLITVSNEDEAPTITTNAVVDVPENQTAVIDIDSTDPEGDVEEGGLTYSITGGADQALFDIDEDTGELTFQAAPDFEMPLDDGGDNVYDVQVTVTDSGQLTGVQDLTITVTDEDEPPTITTDAAVDVLENQTTVIDVESSDQEGDTEGNGLTYTISGGDDESFFDIDADTGELTFVAAPDFENPLDDDTDNVYEVQVTVTDSGQMTGSQDLMVAVTNENEAPTINSDPTATAVDNQIEAIDVDSTDPDGETEGSGLTYEITGGVDEDLFTIDPDTGILSFIDPPDSANPMDDGGDNVYDVQVTVTDAGQLSDVQDIAITVVENQAPIITTVPDVDVMENETVVIDIQTTDGNGETEGGTLAYSLSGGDDESFFQVDPDTGLLTFITAPDFETPQDDDGDNIYEVQVTVTDAGGLTDVQDLIVTVTNENEAPTITSDDDPDVEENQTFVINVESDDPDGESEGAGLPNSKTGGEDLAIFTIDEDTGVLSFINPPNFEAPGDLDTNNVYEVDVTVADAGGLDERQSLTVTVTNTDEGGVSFDGTNLTIDNNTANPEDVTIDIVNGRVVVQGLNGELTNNSGGTANNADQTWTSDTEVGATLNVVLTSSGGGPIRVVSNQNPAGDAPATITDFGGADNLRNVSFASQGTVLDVNMSFNTNENIYLHYRVGEADNGLPNNIVTTDNGINLIQFSNVDNTTTTVLDVESQAHMVALDFSQVTSNVNIDLESAVVLLGGYENMSIELEVPEQHQFIDVLVGGSGDDLLIGNEQDNLLIGRDGSDTLIGNGGNDQLNANRDFSPDVDNNPNEVDNLFDMDDMTLLANQLDEFNEVAGVTDVTKSIYNSFGKYGYGEGTTDFDASFDLANSQDAPASFDFLDGGPGDDAMYGYNNATVTVLGGPGNDIFSTNLNGGPSFIDMEEGDDTVLFKTGDTTMGGQGNDLITEANFDPTRADAITFLFGGDGDDTLNSGQGPDELRGGLGTNLLSLLDSNDSVFGEGGTDVLEGTPGFRA